MSRRYLTATVLGHLDSQLTDHDRAVLRTVSDLRFVNGGQLTRWHFESDQASARAARRALLRLTRLGALERLPRVVGGVGRGSSAFVYRLGSAGQPLAAQRGWQPARRHQSHIPGTLFLGHALQVAELHTLITEADRNGVVELLSLQAEPGCWRRYQAATLKPDSYLRLGAGEYEDSFFLEVDMGSEGSRTIGTKLRAYLAYKASGQEQRERGVFPRVLWTAPDGQRAEVVKNCIRRLPQANRELFAVAEFDEVLTTLMTWA